MVHKSSDQKFHIKYKNVRPPIESISITLTPSQFGMVHEAIKQSTFMIGYELAKLLDDVKQEANRESRM